MALSRRNRTISRCSHVHLRHCFSLAISIVNHSVKSGPTYRCSLKWSFLVPNRAVPALWHCCVTFSQHWKWQNFLHFEYNAKATHQGFAMDPFPFPNNFPLKTCPKAPSPNVVVLSKQSLERVVIQLYHLIFTHRSPFPVYLKGRIQVLDAFDVGVKLIVRKHCRTHLWSVLRSTFAKLLFVSLVWLFSSIITSLTNSKKWSEAASMIRRSGSVLIRVVLVVEGIQDLDIADKGLVWVGSQTVACNNTALLQK